MTPKRIAVSVVAGVLALSAGAARAEELFVTQAKVPVRDDTSMTADEVTTVLKGDKVTVISRQGKWLKVRAGGQEGYIYETAVSDTKPTGNLSVGSQASGGSAAGAAKGVGEALKWADTKHMSKEGLFRLEEIRKEVKGRDYVAFSKDGHVGAEQR